MMSSDLFVPLQQKHVKRTKSAASQTTTEDLTPTPSHEGDSTHHNGAHLDAEESDDPLANILSLKLKKPKSWKWELTTSRSCSNIALPRIMLYNHKGDLLVDANSQEEQVFKQPVSANELRSSRKQKRVTSRAVSSDLDGVIRKALERKFDELQIEEESQPGPMPKILYNRHPITAASSEQQMFELPSCKFERRANSCKEVRFKFDDPAHRSRSNDGSSTFYPVCDLPTPPSTTTTTNSSSGPREKRRFRRSKSSLARSPATSESILERFSSSRGRFSSPELAEEQQLEQAPRYFLRTSKAGTLVVQQQSFSRYRRRRKLRNSSTENILKTSSSKSLSTNSMRLDATKMGVNIDAPSVSMENVATDSQAPKRKKVFPVRRYRSDGNMLLASKRLSSSSSESELRERSKERKSLRKYDAFRKKSKSGLVSLEPDQRNLSSVERPTAR